MGSIVSPMSSIIFCLIACVSSIRLRTQMEATSRPVAEIERHHVVDYPTFLTQSSNLNASQKAAKKLLHTIDLAATILPEVYGDDMLIDMNDKLINAFKDWAQLHDTRAYELFFN